MASRGWIANGFFFGLTFSLLNAVASPAAWALFWSAMSVQAMAAAWLTWMRTGLRWYTLDMAHAATIMAALVPVYLAGYTIQTLPVRWMVVFGVNVALGIAMNLGSAYEDRDKTARWRAVNTRASLTDLLTFRYIPHLR
jgi:hypothetical protein